MGPNRASTDGDANGTAGCSTQFGRGGKIGPGRTAREVGCQASILHCRNPRNVPLAQLQDVLLLSSWLLRAAIHSLGGNRTQSPNSSTVATNILPETAVIFKTPGVGGEGRTRRTLHTTCWHCPGFRLPYVEMNVITGAAPAHLTNLKMPKSLSILKERASGSSFDSSVAFMYSYLMSEAYFFDEAKIYVKAGDGGDGAVAFRREKYEPLGGPAGGHGGRGGDVVVFADPGLNTLLPFKRRQHFKAGNGRHGAGNRKRGADGEDARIAVPPGTVIRDADTGELLLELIHEGQEGVVARGGRGGRGNSAFASPTNQAPRFAEKGEPGEERWLYLELKLIADVGIIGVPNAGKSTLLSVISAARPKIADYPFTTLSPNLGVASVGYKDFVVADIPGLIEGAHEGTGLGDKFLRHIERTRMLVHLLDGASADPLADLEAVNRELELYSQRLADKQQLIVFNKMDLPDAQALWPLIREEMDQRGLPAMAISAVSQENVRDMLQRIASMLDELPRDREPAVEELPVLRPLDTEDSFRLFRRGQRETPEQPLTWRIEGPKVERIATMTDWNNDEAIARFQRQIRALGVFEALEKAGVQDGDTVLIGEIELEWEH